MSPIHECVEILGRLYVPDGQNLSSESEGLIDISKSKYGQENRNIIMQIPSSEKE